MNGPIYQVARFEDGTEHRVLRRDVMKHELTQLQALAATTGNDEALNRWLERWAQKEMDLATAKQGQHTRAHHAREGREAKQRLRYERIREIAEQNYLLTGDELVDKVRLVYRDLYGAEDKKVPSVSTVYRALGLRT
jgi:hypothetical protein